MQNSEHFTTDMIIQYSVVGLVLLAALAWISWKIFRKNKKDEGPCCGCGLSDTCTKKHKTN